MNIFPLLKGWQRTVINSPLFESNTINVNGEKEFVNFNGKGWLYNAQFITNDPNMQLRVMVDDVLYVSTPYLISLLGNNYEHFSTPAYNVDISGSYVYAIRYFNEYGTEFTNNIKITVIPAIETMQITEYDIEFVNITDTNAFVKSFGSLYSISSASVPQSNTTPSTTPTKKVLSDGKDVNIKTIEVY